MLSAAAFPSFFLTLAGFILSLLVTLSVPIIKSIYLLQATISEVSSTVDASVASVINLGVFGICYDGIEATVGNASYSSSSSCTSAAIGYNINPIYFGQTGNGAYIDSIIHGLSGSLFLNTLTCGFAGLCLIVSFLAWFCSSRGFEILTFILLLFSNLLAWLSFALDLALAIIARDRIQDYTDNLFIGHLGNAIWIALGASLALSMATCAAGCGMFGRYGRMYDRTEAPFYDENGVQVVHKRRGIWTRTGGGSSAPMGTY